MRRRETERVLLGWCAVDSGQILLVDPCYVDKGLDYDEVCTSHTEGCSHENHEDFANNMFGGRTYHKGFGGPVKSIMGVVTSSGFGDGQYPVFAEIEDHGDWGKRVARVTIEFVLEMCDNCHKFVESTDNEGFCDDCHVNYCDDCGQEEVDYEGELCDGCEAAQEAEEE